MKEDGAESTGGTRWGAACGKTGRKTGLAPDAGDNNAFLARNRTHHWRRMHSYGQRGMQRNADGAVVRSSLVEERMQVADRQHHCHQQQNNTAGNRNFADADWVAWLRCAW